MVEELAFDLACQDDNGTPVPWETFLADINAKFAHHVPEQCRASAFVRLRVIRGWEPGDEEAEFQVCYLRPETDDEMRGRISMEARREAAIRARELEQLAKLQAKYGRTP